MKRIKKLLISIIFLGIISSSCMKKIEDSPKRYEEQRAVTESIFPSIEDSETVMLPEVKGTLEVHFIDVGQGDCTLLLSDDKVMLIDCAEEIYGTAIQNYLQKRDIKKIDYLILTHPDADHIGGAATVITKFDVETI